MHYHVYFNVGGRPRGPFGLEAADREAMFQQAATVRDDLQLPPETGLLIEAEAATVKPMPLIAAATSAVALVLLTTKAWSLTYGGCLLCLLLY
ncbi:hypothetical protein [Aeromonas sp. 30P]|uniref:hypothetical protein n=1 Tax=Aeromonas sp. 30P TaxID=3452717 RepID=UPI003F7ADFEC